jgi:hypothetical protein
MNPHEMNQKKSPHNEAIYNLPSAKIPPVRLLVGYEQPTGRKNVN